LIDRSVGGDAIFLNNIKYPQLKSLRDLKEAQSQGQQLTITYAENTPSEFLALFLSDDFEEFNLQNFHEQKKVKDSSEAWNLLKDTNQNVAVAVLWEPDIGEATKQGYTKILSSDDVPNIIIDVLVASDGIISSQPKQITTFLTAYYNRSLRKDQGIEFFNSGKAQKWMTDGTLEERIKSTVALLQLHGKLNQVPKNPKDLFTSQFVEKAAEDIGDAPEPTVTETPTPGGLRNSIGKLRKLKEIKFAVDSAELTQEAKSILDKISQRIIEYEAQNFVIKVIGHTSKSRFPSLNKNLSQSRAKVVEQYLRNNSKLQYYTIESEGKDDSELLPGISPDDSKNQRTEIQILRSD
jgi:OmpA-OmpF porin, OOP family